MKFIWHYFTRCRVINRHDQKYTFEPFFSQCVSDVFRTMIYLCVQLQFIHDVYLSFVDFCKIFHFGCKQPFGREVEVISQNCYCDLVSHIPNWQTPACPKQIWITRSVKKIQKLVLLLYAGGCSCGGMGMAFSYVCEFVCVCPCS